MEIEECHAEDGGEPGAREEDSAEEGDGFHGRGVTFRGVGELALFAGHLEVQFGFFLGDDVV